MPNKFIEDIDGTRWTYKTITLDELYPEDCRSGCALEYGHDLFVYSVTNNPDGAGPWTGAKYMGVAETYTQAADLMAAAEAASDAIGSSVYPVEFCIKVPYEPRGLSDADRLALISELNALGSTHGYEDTQDMIERALNCDDVDEAANLRSIYIDGNREEEED